MQARSKSAPGRFVLQDIMSCRLATFHENACRRRFSWQGRGICPSCNTRRMAETAAHLVDHGFPQVPIVPVGIICAQTVTPLLNSARGVCQRPILEDVQDQTVHLCAGGIVKSGPRPLLTPRYGLDKMDLCGGGLAQRNPFLIRRYLDPPRDYGYWQSAPPLISHLGIQLPRLFLKGGIGAVLS
jgi:hypothetical protein